MSHIAGLLVIGSANDKNSNLATQNYTDHKRTHMYRKPYGWKLNSSPMPFKIYILMNRQKWILNDSKKFKRGIGIEGEKIMETG